MRAAHRLLVARQRAPARERGVPRRRARRGNELTVDEFPQIAAHVEGFRAAIPAAPANVDRRPPSSRAPSCSAPRTSCRRPLRCRRSRPQKRSAFPRSTRAGEIRSLEAMEADMIRLALGRYRGHMTEVAKRLNIGRSTLYRKMRDYGLEERARTDLNGSATRSRSRRRAARQAGPSRVPIVRLTLCDRAMAQNRHKF